MHLNRTIYYFISYKLVPKPVINPKAKFAKNAKKKFRLKN